MPEGSCNISTCALTEIEPAGVRMFPLIAEDVSSAITEADNPSAKTTALDMSERR